MSLREGLIQAVVILCVFGGIGYIILAKLVSKSPKTAEFIRQFSPGKLYEKIPPTEEMLGKAEQVWDDKRTMM